MLTLMQTVYAYTSREQQLKLEKIRATQQHIEEYKRQRDEWRRQERERMEAENRRIMEFVSNQDNQKQNRMNEMREREEAKDNLRKQVGTRTLWSFCLIKNVSQTFCVPLAFGDDPEGNSAA